MQGAQRAMVLANPRGIVSSRMPLVSGMRAGLRASWVRNSSAILVTSALTYGLGFLFWLAVARTYAPSDMGIGVTLQTVVLFLAEVGTLGLPFGIVRFLPSQPKKTEFLNGAITRAMLVTPAVGLAFVVGLQWWAPSLKFVAADGAFALAFFLSLVGFAVAAIVDSAFVAERRAGFGTVRMGLYAGLRLPLPVLVAPLLGGFGIIFSWTVALAASLGVAIVVLLPSVIRGYRFRPRLAPFRSAEVLRYSAWSESASVVNVGAMALLPLLILNTLGGDGPASTAFFYAAFSLATLLYLVPESFATAMFAEGSQPESRYRRHLPPALGASAALLAPAVAIALAGGRLILGLFGDPYPDRSFSSLVILAAASPVVMGNRFLSTDLRVNRQVRSLFLVTTVSSSLMVVIAYATIGALGIRGAALGFLVGQALALPLFLLAKRKAVRAPASRSMAPANPKGKGGNDVSLSGDDDGLANER